MKRVLMFVVPVLALLISLGTTNSGFAAPDEKSARGTLTAMTADTLTVKTGTGQMTFQVDTKTEVIAPGGGTKARRAEAVGQHGPKLADVVSIGKAMRVTYHEMGGTNHASRIEVISSAGSNAQAGHGPAAKTAEGLVTAVSAGSLTLTSGGKAWTFAIDPSTVVSRQGAGTKARANGGRIAITELVADGDRVSVSYHETGAMMHAASVRVTAKGAKS